MEQLKLQLSSKTITKNDFEPNIKDIFSFDDFTLEGYEPHPMIKMFQYNRLNV
jgi:thymidylate synthase